MSEFWFFEDRNNIDQKGSGAMTLSKRKGSSQWTRMDNGQFDGHRIVSSTKHRGYVLVFTQTGIYRMDTKRTFFEWLKDLFCF